MQVFNVIIHIFCLKLLNSRPEDRYAVYIRKISTYCVRWKFRRLLGRRRNHHLKMSFLSIKSSANLLSHAYALEQWFLTLWFLHFKKWSIKLYHPWLNCVHWCTKTNNHACLVTNSANCSLSICLFLLRLAISSFHYVFLCFRKLCIVNFSR